MIALGKVLYNLFSARLWIAIAVVIVVTNLLKTLLLHVGLVIGDVAEFINEIVAVVFEVVNAVANEASKVGHGFKDFFTGHFKRLSHEGDYATRTHLTVPPILSQLASLKDHIDDTKESPVGQALAELIRLLARVRVCPSLAYFRTISLSRWIINGLVDALLPGLCENKVSRVIQVMLFLFDGLPRLLGWIGSTGVLLWLILIEGWPLIEWGLLVLFEVTVFAWIKVRDSLRFLENPSDKQNGWISYSKPLR